MQLINTLAPLAALAGLAVAAPAAVPDASNLAKRSFQVPSLNGFPNSNAQQKQAIGVTADGMLTNAPPPPQLNPKSIPAFQLIQFNENFECAYFSSLIYNITNNLPGFTLETEAQKTEILDILVTVLAQEELHALNAAAVLNNFKAFSPPPCNYVFPTDNIVDAITLASTFTDLVLGTLQDAQQLLATNGDVVPVRAVGSVIGNEAEQNGYYRIILGRKPSQKPFLTTSVAPYAFSALQAFVASCPFDVTQIPIPIFPALKVLSGSNGANVSPNDQTLQFSADLTGYAPAQPYYGKSNMFITYLSGQNLPQSVPVTNAKWSGQVVTFEADFPYSEFLMAGLTIAGLTTSGNITTPDAIVNVTLAAPGLIEVNDLVKAWDSSM